MSVSRKDLPYAVACDHEHSILAVTNATQLVDFNGETMTVQPSEIDGQLECADQIRVLVVEDNQIKQKVATVLLRRLGFQMDIAGNGLVAIRSLLPSA